LAPGCYWLGLGGGPVAKPSTKAPNATSIAYSRLMKHSQARQIKWDLVDALIENFRDSETYNEYSQEEREYATSVIKRLAASLNVTNHISL
jgi:hypothetical protein